MKKIILPLCFLLSITIFSQKEITLEEAITIAQKKSPDYKALLNQNQASYWRFRNYKASFLPQLRLDATIPQYSNFTRRITNDTGQDIFVRTNQSANFEPCCRRGGTGNARKDKAVFRRLGYKYELLMPAHAPGQWSLAPLKHPQRRKARACESKGVSASGARYRGMWNESDLAARCACPPRARVPRS